MAIPIAVAGADQDFSHPYALPQVVNLDGSGSYDPDGGTITGYQWYFLAKPTGSTAVLSSDTVVNPTFTADVEGNYLLFLVVTDSGAETSEDNPAVAPNSSYTVVRFKTVNLDLSKPAAGEYNWESYAWEWVDALETLFGLAPAHASDIVEGITYLSDAPTVAAHPEALGTNNQDWVDMRNVRSIINEQSGFASLVATSLSFTDGTLTFTITPTAASFDYWHAGTLYTKIGAQSVVINNVEGLWYIYYSAGTLSRSQTPWTLSLHVPVAVVYWNATAGAHLTLEDKRYGLVMDHHTQRMVRNTSGAIKLQYGAGISWTSGDGSLDAHAEVDIEDLGLFDLELLQEYSDGSPQALATLNAPVVYRDGANNWRQTTADSFPVYDGVGTGRCGYNLGPAIWSVSECTDGYHFAMWICATTDTTQPIVALLGQREDQYLAGAKDNNTWTSLIYPATAHQQPYNDMKPLFRLIFQTATAYANTPKTRLVDVMDVRRDPLIHAFNVASTPLNHRAMVDYQFHDHDNAHEVLNKGVYSGCTVTVFGVNTIQYSSGAIYDPVTNTLVAITGTIGVAVTGNDINFVKWVLGASLTVSTTAPSGNEVLVAVVGSQGGDIEYVANVRPIGTSITRMIECQARTLPAVVESGMELTLDVSGAPTYYFDLSAGAYAAIGSIMTTVPALNTGVIPFTTHYHAAGAWTTGTGSEPLDFHNEYDDGTDLAAIDPTKFYKYLFLYFGGLHLVYGDTAYDNKADAINGKWTCLPPGLANAVPVLEYVVRASTISSSNGHNNHWIDCRPTFHRQQTTDDGYQDNLDQITALGTENTDVVMHCQAVKNGMYDTTNWRETPGTAGNYQGIKYTNIPTGTTEHVIIYCSPPLRTSVNKGRKLTSVGVAYNIDTNPFTAVTLVIAKVSPPTADGNPPTRIAIATTESPLITETAAGDRYLIHTVDTPAYLVGAEYLQAELTIDNSTGANRTMTIWGADFRFSETLVDLS